MNISTVVLLISIVGMAHGLSWAMSDEKRLIKMLKDQYERIGKDGRPVANINDTMIVKFGLNMVHIPEIDFKTQTIEVSAWPVMEWEDEFLKWDPSEFGGVKRLRMHPRDIFLPDIVAFNAASEEQHLVAGGSMVVVSHTGEVLRVPSVKQRFICDVPHSEGPKEFTCEIKYGSWTYDGNSMDMKLSAESADTSYYKPHPLWELTNTSAKRNVVHYPCCPEPYVDVTFTLDLKFTHPKSSNAINQA